MKTFEFTALDGSGRNHSGALEADNGELALRRIKEMCLFPTKVMEKTRTIPKSEAKIRAGGRVPAEHWRRPKRSNAAQKTRELERPRMGVGPL